MNQTSIARSIQDYLKDLGKEEQEKVLEFAKSLSLHKIEGVHTSSFHGVAGSISMEDLESMRKAIEEDCEQVKTDEW
jgi:hypothetical protein